MSRLAQRLRAQLFATTPNDWQVYHSEISARLTPGAVVLDLGCGKGQIAPFPWADYPSCHVIGADVDPEAKQNPALDEFLQLGDDPDWAVSDASIDLVLARYVLEHVAAPDPFMDNVARVLKPGGSFVFLTPNRAHPIMVASRMLPLRWHQKILRLTRNLDPSDVFPTHYRANDIDMLSQLAERHGMDISTLSISDYQPSGYLDFTAAGFVVSTAWYYSTRLTGLDRLLGASILGVFTRRDERGDPKVRA